VRSIVTKYLIVNADDFGMSSGVSRGILQAHAGGIVTSTTALVNAPGAGDALALASRVPGVGLGLHLNLSFGQPVLPPAQVPSLVGPDGRFFSGDRLLAAMKRFRKQDIERELRAQFAHFVGLAGRPPDHLDSHQFIACLQPAVFAAMLELAASAQVPIRDPGDFLDVGRLERFLQRVSAENAGTGPDFRDFVDLPDTLSALRRHLPPFRSPDVFHYQFYGSGARPEVFLDFLGALRDGVTEVMCHPGYADGLGDAYCWPREHELAILLDPHLRRAIEDHGAQLVSFAVLGPPSNRSVG
jgi:predicted glycoside hydrolase/deacetylase ChbG (UPF0249 family)